METNENQNYYIEKQQSRQQLSVDLPCMHVSQKYAWSQCSHTISAVSFKKMLRIYCSNTIVILSIGNLTELHDQK